MSGSKTTWRRVPPSLFGVPFGVAGLSEVWRAAAPVLGISLVISNAVCIASALLWGAVVAGYAASGPRQIMADLRDPMLAPFVPLATITPMILAAGLTSYALSAARLLVVGFVVITISVGGWLTGQWIVEHLDEGAVHPGYFLPTVAGGLIGAFAADQVHLHALAYACFGVGMLCWALLGSQLLHRLFFHTALPAPLVPTLAIEVAPPVVAGIAYNALSGGATNIFAYALAGYGVLMVMVQIRFIPVYARLRFSPGFWAFTFSFAAVGTDSVEWIAIERPAGAAVYTGLIVAVLSVFVFAIAARSVVAVRRGQFFPPSIPPTPQPPLVARSDLIPAVRFGAAGSRTHIPTTTLERKP